MSMEVTCYAKSLLQLSLAAHLLSLATMLADLRCSCGCSLKPEQLLLDSPIDLQAPAAGTLKVADWGFARHTSKLPLQLPRFM